MRRERLSLSMLVLVAFSRLAFADADEARLYHVPLAHAQPGEGITIQAVVERAWEASIELRYRRVGATEWRHVAFLLESEDRYTARIPGEATMPPGVEYYIHSTARDGTRRLHFASEANPHRVLIREDAQTVRRLEELYRLKNRRARARLAFENVDFGERSVDGEAVDDKYLRIEADFTYRLLMYPLYSLRFGFTRLLGETVAPNEERCEGRAECQEGFRAGGWFELGFRLSRNVCLDWRAAVQATGEGFNLGTRGELRLGGELGTHVAFGIEAVRDVGLAGFFRLGWDTVPKLPMAATIELTDFPAPYRPHALRLLFDVAYEFDGGLRAGVRAGYQARDQEIGNATLGANIALDF
ncbi:MAG: hypothetical protein V2A73_22095 [Pseudomonadota bacterium]